MARPLSHPRIQTRVLVGAAAVALVLSLLPLEASRWVGWFADVTRNVIAPISHPITRFSTWVSPGDPLAADPEVVRRLKRERERYRTLYRRQLAENRDLRARLETLDAAWAVGLERPYAIATAPVVGRSGDLGGRTLTVRLGRSRGVGRNAVATVGGYQLVGRVVETGSRTCQVRPITDPDAGALLGRIMLDEDGGGPICRLRPTGEGTLRGPVEDRSDGGTGEAEAVERGQNVRLDDPAWPTNARMLIIGRVERVRSDPDQPLRRIVEVRPRARLDRLGQVELRIASPDEGPSRSSAAGPRTGDEGGEGGEG